MKCDKEYMKVINRMFGWDNIQTRAPFKLEEVRNSSEFTPKHVYCSPKAKVTVVVFEDGSKEICRCAKGDVYNEYAGICICLAKHFYGKAKIEKLNSKNKTVYNDDHKTKGAK